MGFFQFVKNELNRVNDRLDGRTLSYNDLCEPFVSKVKHEVTEHFGWLSFATPKNEFIEFLTAQAILWCEARGIFMFRSSYEMKYLASNVRFRYFDAFAAMRKGLDEGNIYFHTHLWKIVQRECPTVNYLMNKDLIGFDIIDEYHKRIKEFDRPQLMEYGYNFFSHKIETVRKTLFDWFNITEDETFRKHYDTIFYRPPSSDKFCPKYDSFLIHTFHLFTESMENVRLTDISDTYV